MFEFYFPDIMESSSDGNWWPSIIGSLLGALISGLVAIWIFRRGLQNERKVENERLQNEKEEKETYLLNQLDFFVELMEELVQSKQDTYLFNKEFAKNYRENPVGYHPHKIETLGEIELLQKIDSREIKEALAIKLEGDSASSVFRIFYKNLSYYQQHSKVYRTNVHTLKDEWTAVGTKFKVHTLNVRMDVYNFLAPLAYKEHESNEEAELYNLLNRLLHTYIRNGEGQILDLGYHYDSFIRKIVLATTPERLVGFPEFAAISNRAKQAEFLFIDLKEKANELADFVDSIDIYLNVANEKMEKVIKDHFSPSFKLKQVLEEEKVVTGSNIKAK